METTTETTSETTPLLPHSPPSPPSPSRRNPALILSISISTLSFFYTFPTSIWVKSIPNGPNFDWGTGRCANSVFNLSIISAFSLALSIARHRKSLSGPFAFFAFVIDVVIGMFGVAHATYGFEELGYTPLCGDPGVPVEWRCRSLVVDVLLRVGLACGLGVVFVHALFVFGALVSAVRIVRLGYRTWRFPTGQLTLEFAIKVLRPEEMRDEEALVPQA
ncbi:hypothetical protein BJX96DRAFT_39407 [Aspergillus floccosus]